MKYCIKHGPVFSVLEVELAEGEMVVAQPNSMLTMTGGIQIAAKAGRRGASSGWWSGFANLLGGESFFTAEFRAKRDGEIVTLAPNSYGDILVLPVDSESFYLTRGSYLANMGDSKLRTKYGGMKSLLSRKGLFLLHASGVGTVFCQTYGQVIEKTLGTEERFCVNNRYVVAFSESISYQLVKATENVKDSIMSGEGLVNRYTGPGRLFYQTRGKPSGSILGHIIDAAT